MRSGDYKSEQWQKPCGMRSTCIARHWRLLAEERAAVYEKGNSELASWVVADAQHLATLLLDLSIASPLTFKMNPNL